MIDSQVQRLITQAVDTPTKLHLLLIFHEHSLQELTAAEMAERICRDIWSVSQSLSELAEDGILSVHQAMNDAVYSYHPRQEYIEPIHCLVEHFEDPLQRDDVRRLIQELGSYASFRRSSFHEAVDRPIS